MNLADKNPDKLEELKAKFALAMEEFDVLPLDDRGAGRLAVPKPDVPGADPAGKVFTYYEGATRIPESAAPSMKNQSWTLTAKVKAEGDKTNGVVLGYGGLAAGLSLYLEKGVPVFVYNYFGDDTKLKGSALIDGEATLVVDFAYDVGDKPGAGGVVTFSQDGKSLAQERLKSTVPGRFGIDTFGVGEDTGQPVTRDYQAPNKFTGEIEQVTVEMK